MTSVSSSNSSGVSRIFWLWQRPASAAWLELNQMGLEEIAASKLVIISRPLRARLLLQVACEKRTLATRLLRRFGGRIEKLPRNLQAQSAHPPIRIGGRLEIVSRFSRSPEKRSLQLVIPAAGAFGTGEHATTAMSLRLLEERTRKFPRGWRLLDAGTGSGILALAARKLGAGEALGLDDDPRAIATARQNTRLNRIGRVEFCVADLLRFKPKARYEIVTANLFSDLLIAALPVFRRALRPDGWLILSGILRAQADEVIAALLRAGWTIEKRRRRGKWVALACSRRAASPGRKAS